MAALRVEEVLFLWREAERVRDALPRDDPDRAVVTVELVGIHEVYRRLTDLSAASRTSLVASGQRIAAARDTLARVRAKNEAR